jgi:hypothetical protein
MTKDDIKHCLSLGLGPTIDQRVVILTITRPEADVRKVIDEGIQAWANLLWQGMKGWPDLSDKLEYKKEIWELINSGWLDNNLDTLYKELAHERVKARMKK